MGTLQEIKALRDKALLAHESHTLSTYELTRDAQNNLLVSWKDGYEIKIPIINYRPYQLEVRDALINGTSKRILAQWPRRSGKEVTTWNIILDFAISEPGMYIIAYPTNVRARKILWEGAMLDKTTGKSIKFIEMIPKRLLSRRPNAADMSIHLTNGSLIWVVGCDIDPDKLRGTNPRGIVFSELAFSDPSVLYNMLPVLRQNGGWLFGQSTYDGMNHFYWMLKKNKDDPLWHCREESINTLVDNDGNPYITDEDVDEDRRAGMPEYLIQQEYYGNVQINEETKYFAIAINEIHKSERIIKNHYLPNKNVYSFYDIGVSDYTAITLAQFETRAGKLWPHVIGYIENNNRALSYYVDEIRRFCNARNLSFKHHFLPHDGANRNFGDGLKTTQDYLSDLGEMGLLVKRPSSHKTANEAIRQKLFMTTFNEENTQRLIDCLSSYEKEYDDKMGKFKDNPKHDWSSHGCFIGNTYVLTRYGHCMIMNLPETGEVLTSCGWKQYINPRITRKNAQLVEVVFKKGYTVKCTPDHLFKTESGWKSAESLQNSTMIQSSLTQLHNISMADYISFGQVSHIIQEVAKNYIDMYGKLHSEKYQITAISIIEIMINQTIQFLILSVLTLKNIYQRIGMKLNIQDLIDSAVKPEKRQENLYEHPKLGLDKVKPSFALSRGQSGSVKKGIVWCVILSLMDLLEKAAMFRSFVQQDAGLYIDHVKKISEKEDVWCLTVPELEEFSLANGALVHNCKSYQTLALALDAELITEVAYDVIYYNQNN